LQELESRCEALEEHNRQLHAEIETLQADQSAAQEAEMGVAARLGEVDALWKQLGEVTEAGQEAAEEREHWRQSNTDAEERLAHLEAQLVAQSEQHRAERGLLEAAVESAAHGSEALQARLTNEASMLDQRLAAAARAEQDARAAQSHCEEALRDVHASSHVASAEHALAVQELRLAAEHKEGERKLWQSKAECAEEKEAWLRGRLEEREGEARRELASREGACRETLAAQMGAERERWEGERKAGEQTQQLESAALRREAEEAQKALAAVEAEFREALVDHEAQFGTLQGAFAGSCQEAADLRHLLKAQAAKEEGNLSLLAQLQGLVADQRSSLEQASEVKVGLKGSLAECKTALAAEKRRTGDLDALEDSAEEARNEARIRGQQASQLRQEKAEILERHEEEAVSLRGRVNTVETELRSMIRERGSLEADLKESRQLEREHAEALRDAYARQSALEAERTSHKETVRSLREELIRERDQGELQLEAAKADAHDRLAVLEIQLREKAERYEVVASSLEASEELVRELDARLEKYREDRDVAEQRAEKLREEAEKKDEMLQFVETEVTRASPLALTRAATLQDNSN